MAIYLWKGGAGFWTASADWLPHAVPGAHDIALIGPGADITVPNASTPLPSPTSPDGLAVGAVEIAYGATLVLAPGTNVGEGYYNLPSGYSPSTNTFTIEGIAPVLNAGKIQLSPGSSMRVTGLVINTGTIALETTLPLATGDESNLVIVGKSTDGICGGVTLLGGGTVTMGDSPDNVINGTVLETLAQDILISNNTIEGAGTISHLTFTNFGTVNSEYSDNFLYLSGDAVTNYSVLESTNHSEGLVVDNGATIHNVGAGVLDATSGSQIWLADATIEGGALEGQFYLFGSDVLLEGPLTIASGADVWVSDGFTMTLEGAISNKGTITVASSGDATDLAISGAVTLSGGGAVALTGETENAILDNGARATLTNVDNTISGAGSIGNGDKKLTLVNLSHGVIDGNASNSLTINTGNVVTNAGLIESTGSAPLMIDDAVQNAGGTLAASDGSLTVKGAVSGGAATINGTTLEFGGPSNASTAFVGADGLLRLDDALAFAGSISGFASYAGSIIDLVDIPYVAGVTTFSFQENKAGTAGVLTVSDHADHGPSVSLTLLGQYSASEFSLSADSSSPAGTDVSYGTSSVMAATLLAAHH